MPVIWNLLTHEQLTVPPTDALPFDAGLGLQSSSAEECLHSPGAQSPWML